MKTKKYFQRLGTTSACVRRMLDAAVKFCTNEKLQEEEQDLYSENGDIDASVPFYEHNNIDNARRAARAQGYLPTRPETAQDSPSAQEQTVSQYMIFFNFGVSLTFIVCYARQQAKNQDRRQRWRRDFLLVTRGLGVLSPQWK